MKSISHISLPIAIAAREDAEDLEQIYCSVQISKQNFLDLAGTGERHLAARDRVSRLGGFINPPEKSDMQLALEHGLIFIYRQEGRVLGFNRVVIDSVQVMRFFCEEFHIENQEEITSENDFGDWQGSKLIKDRTTLRAVQWVDRELAFNALLSARCGVRGERCGKLIWAIDAAVRPESQNTGISTSLVEAMGMKFEGEYAYRAFRFFEILHVNGRDVAQQNSPSRRTFTRGNTRPFAYTDVDVSIRVDLKLGIRWHQWLRLL